MLPYTTIIKITAIKTVIFLVYNLSKTNYFIQSGIKYVFASVLITIYDLLSYP